MDGEQPTPVDIPQTPPSRNRTGLWVALGVGMVVILGLGFFLLNKNGDSDKSSGTAPSAAASQLYDVLGNAAKQPRLHVGMYRATYANKADADAKQNTGSIASSVSEVDTEAGKYRSVFAHNLLEEDKSFTIGRCLDGVTYNDIYNQPPGEGPPATSLKDVPSHLTLVPQGHLYKVTEPLTYIACPHLGILPSSPPLAVARLSDGVFPVTFTDAQAANWVKRVKQAALFNVSDEGMVEMGGRQLRKLSFTPKSDTGASSTLYNIFYETGEIERIKSEQPKAEWQYEFLTMNPLNTGSVGGFYLIDEQTKLPVYSELYSTNPDKKTGETRAAGHNIARTKQTYAFPSQLTLTLDTPLEFVE